MVKSAAALEFIGIAAEEVSGFLRLAECLHAILADLQRQCRGNTVDALLDELRDALQQLDARRQRAAPPRRPGALRRLHRRFNIGRAGQRERAQYLALIGRIAGFSQRARVVIGAIDVERLPGAQLGLGQAHRGFIAGVQLWRRIEHRGIGQLETHVTAFG